VKQRRVSGEGILPAEIYGILSLILWALIIIVTLKYVLLLLRVDNKGEGGILSLMAMAQKRVTSRQENRVLRGDYGRSAVLRRCCHYTGHFRSVGGGRFKARHACIR
jgi:K+ transporter